LSRKFSIDLSPTIFYSRGSFIELLISSDVSKYCEFRMVTHILTLNKEGCLEKVPTSRSEVFKSNKLSIIEKRLMMKFIQQCMKDENIEELIDDKNKQCSIENLTFREFVLSKNLSEPVNNYLINAVCMSPNQNQNVIDVNIKILIINFN
jgi:RAB protein geranylgeranyltransferase component A